ncbi:hypothetical protein BDR06DRAFT_197224 [Suillus hirtellus]|nr:hypothetical protein BDR06DRAFT_197224 [Suillus hirtellus]
MDEWHRRGAMIGAEECNVEVITGWSPPRMRNLPHLHKCLIYQTAVSPPAMSPIMPKVLPRVMAVVLFLLELELTLTVLIGYIIKDAPVLPPLNPEWPV